MDRIIDIVLGALLGLTFIACIKFLGAETSSLSAFLAGLAGYLIVNNIRKT